MIITESAMILIVVSFSLILVLGIALLITLIRYNKYEQYEENYDSGLYIVNKKRR